MKRALKYFYDNFAMLESEYKYTSGPKDAPSTDCQYSAARATNVKVKHIHNLARLKHFKTFLQKQPLIIGISANNKYIHSYSSGVID